MNMKISGSGKFVIGLIVGAFFLSGSAIAVNKYVATNSPEKGYLLCANKKTGAVTFPNKLVCPAGTTALDLGAVTGIEGPAGPAGLNGANGLPSYVAIEPSTTLTANMTLLLANAGQGGGGGAGSAGTAGVAGTVATIAGMCLSGRGVFNFLAGQAGATGGTTTAVGGSITPPTTGLRVTGGAGGGGNNGATPQLGGAISAIAGALGTDFFPLPLSAGAVASGATPAAVSTSGFISKNFLFNFGGAGGSGSTNTAGGTSGRAGNGAPGCGGGGGGGENSAAGGVSKSGNGGPGFVYIISW